MERDFAFCQRKLVTEKSNENANYIERRKERMLYMFK